MSLKEKYNHAKNYSPIYLTCSLVKSKNENFVKKLIKAFPNLSFEELKLSYYIRSQISTKEIASRMSLSLRGTETKRYRLRKKLGLDRSTNLTSYIRNI